MSLLCKGNLARLQHFRDTHLNRASSLSESYNQVVAVSTYYSASSPEL